MTDPGALKQRLVLEVPAETPDGAGGVTRDYATVATLWAAVTPVAARESVVAEDGGASVTHRILIRMRDDLTTRHRLRKGERIWRITGMRDADASGRFLLIEAEERED
jgi:SPP1 family predicted phage head-tail adaptor